MHQQTTITKPLTNRDSTKQHYTVIAYLNQNRQQAGTGSLYKTLYKKFTIEETQDLAIQPIPLQLTLNRVVKRGVDVLLSLMVVTTILPWLIPIMAICIKAGSRGPIFFLQKRNKKNGEFFTCIKFRSMLVNNDADELPATENDSRITFIGGFMRRTFIDELPQFINVLLGDMSVIGPRPHMLSEHFRFEANIPHYSVRQKIKPGITGLSQVMGLEGAVNTLQRMNDRVVVDNFYVRHWSVKLDLIIVYKTICKMIGL